MIITKQIHQLDRREDWFPQKIYLHFDGPAKKSVAERLVTSAEAVASHSFLPLMSFEKRERRFKRQKSGLSEVKVKVRRLAYPSNMDACVFSYYAHLLNQPYEALIKESGIENCVIGYRKVGSNIDLARTAFAEIAHRGSCVAFAFDISGFFDNIDHTVLKRNWCRLLGTSTLPQGHNKVFQNLTQFSTVDRRLCLERLGYRPNSRDREIANRPICSIEEFRSIVKGRDRRLPSLITPWLKDYRIPQGTPLSALAANISMIDFDMRINDAIKCLGGSYRRYSDDILIIVPISAGSEVPEILRLHLKHYTRRLRINEKKTDIVEFTSEAVASGKIERGLQYLGFTFDGRETLIRSSTISKYYRRLHQAARNAKRQHTKALNGHISGRATLHKRSILANMSHLGTKNFVTSYSVRAANAFNKRPIRRQLSNHFSKLKRLLEN